MEELGIGRPSTYASILAVLREREYVRLEKKRLVAEDKGLLVIAFLESFFKKLVEYDFTADLEEKLDRISNHEIDWKAVLREFWREFSAAVGETKELRTGEVLDALNELLAPHIFPAKADGGDPRACPSCGNGQLSLRLGKFGAFIGCSNYPECRYTRQLMAAGGDAAESFGDEGTPGVKLLGEDPETGLPVTLRDGRFGVFLQLGEAVEKGDKPKRSSLPPGVSPDSIDLERALQLLALPRPVATHPESGEPILVGIGRYGPYVQHGKTYANLEKDDDVLAIGQNRAIDLIVAKESGAVYRRGAARDPGRPLGEDPGSGKTVVVKAGRFGPYVTDGEVNATIPRAMSPDAVTLDEAIALLNARRAAGPSKKPRRGARAASKAPVKGAAKSGAKKGAGAKKAAGKKRAKSASA
jgi:DNA topoisomerase-1